MITEDRAEINAALAKMKEAAGDPAKREEIFAAWNKVCDQLQAFYLSRRPKLKFFEVHHMNEVARMRFALSFAAGKSLDDCISLAVGEIIT